VLDPGQRRRRTFASRAEVEAQIPRLPGGGQGAPALVAVGPGHRVEALEVPR